MAKCTYCEKPITLKEQCSSDPNAVVKEIRTILFIRKEIMYSCPHCEKVLGFNSVRESLFSRL